MTVLESRADKIERWIITGLISAAVIFSIITELTNLDRGWYIPAVFLGILLVVRLLSPVDGMEKDLKYLTEKVGTASTVQSYDRVSDFYKQLRGAMTVADDTLDLTHIRRDAPEDFHGEHPSEYFKEVVQWARKHPDGQIRRVVAVSSEGMRVWAAKLNDETAQVSNYRVRVIEWGSIPAINMAILDRKTTFLAVTGEDADRTKGLAMENADISRYFIAYYDVLWRSGTPLNEWTAQNPVSGAV